MSRNLPGQWEISRLILVFQKKKKSEDIQDKAVTGKEDPDFLFTSSLGNGEFKYKPSKKAWPPQVSGCHAG